jgi:Domain of unknown function (DUF1877)
MGALGVHFALTKDQADSVLAAKSDRKLMDLVEQMEKAWDESFLAQSDKAWDAIHRCLTDGSLLYESGEYPLNHCICGGRQLYRGRNYTVSFVSVGQVKDVAEALGTITQRWMRQRYDLIGADYDRELDDEDFDYTWSNFLDVRRFYGKAAEARRAVIFTVDC